MNSNIETGGPAFPQGMHNGMTLRDYFAAKALQGLLSDSEVRGSGAEFAKRSYDLADAMIKAKETK